MSATMEIGLKSLDGRVDTVIVAKTSNNICGRMKPTGCKSKTSGNIWGTFLFQSLEKGVKLTFLLLQIIATRCFLWNRFLEVTMNLVPDCIHWGRQQLVPLVRMRDLEQVTLVTWTPIAYSSQSVVTEIWIICWNTCHVYEDATLQVATILVAMAPKILELATWFGE